jgi:hypothetical protein
MAEIGRPCFGRTVAGITRRDFVQAVLASSALYGIGCGSAIVGAGIGGLGAASALIAAGKNVIVLEARNRVGGRAFSDNSFATPVDLGAEWFQFVTPLSGGSLGHTIPGKSPRGWCSRRSQAESTGREISDDAFHT